MEVSATHARRSVSLTHCLGLGTCQLSQVGGGQGPEGKQRFLWIGAGRGGCRGRMDFSGPNVEVSTKEEPSGKNKGSHWSRTQKLPQGV